MLVEVTKDLTTVEGINFISEVSEKKSLQVHVRNQQGLAVGKFDNLYVSTDVVPTVESAGRTWMDRNLGASRAAASPDDAEADGDLYRLSADIASCECDS